MTRFLLILTLMCLFGCTNTDSNEPDKLKQAVKPQLTQPVKMAKPASVVSKAATSKAIRKPKVPFSIKACFSACNHRTDGSKPGCLKRCRTSAMLRANSRPNMDINTCRLTCDSKHGIERNNCLRACNPAAQDVPSGKTFIKVSDIAKKFCTLKCAKKDPGLQTQCIEKCVSAQKLAPGKRAINQ